MSMLLSCSNRGCGYSDYHRLDESTNEVMCTKCAKPVSVSSYAKAALKSAGQLVKQVRSEFEVTCDICKAVDGPALKRFGKMTTKVVCKQCGEINQHLSKYFVEAIRLKPGVEISDATPEEMEAAGIKRPDRFNRAKMTQLGTLPQAGMVVTPPEDVEVNVESNEPIKVEYYPNKSEDKGTKVASGTGTVVIQPTADEPINVDNHSLPSPKQATVRKQTKVTPSEAAVRQRIENMPAVLGTPSVSKEPPGLNLIDFAQTGVTDYAGDVED